MVGLPWEPKRGRRNEPTRSNISIPRVAEGPPDPYIEPEAKERRPKRDSITQDAMKKHGYTLGCYGCNQARRYGNFGRRTMPYEI